MQAERGVRGLVGNFPSAQVDELIGEARAEAYATVKARLRDEMERSLLEQVKARLGRPREREAATPGASAEGDGLWVYCVAGEGLARVPVAAQGVAGGRAPRAIRVDGLCALVSDVPLSDYGEEPLKRNLNDLDWLEAVARTHESVLDTALAHGPVVPMRVCTIYSSEAHVEAMLAERRAAFEDVLVALAGRAEWGVKIIAGRGHVPAAAQPPSTGQRGDGGSYLDRKRQDRRRREEADALLDGAVRESHARLEEWAVASELLAPQRPELAGYEGEMVFNAAYLVDDDRVERFKEMVEELEREYVDAGLAFDLSGPWPPFHFVERLGSTRESAR